jgi:hypothetical protein
MQDVEQATPPHSCLDLSATARRRLHACKRSGEIRLQVRQRFDAHRQAQQAIA